MTALTFRVLLSSASLTHSDELFEPGEYATLTAANAAAARIRQAQPGILAWALPNDADAANVLRGGYRAIVHTFPNGARIDGGFIRSGHAQQIARWDVAEAERAASRMRHVNTGHTFDVVDWRNIVEHTSPHGVALKGTRRRLAKRGIDVSLVAYDEARGLFTFDEYAR